MSQSDLKARPIFHHKADSIAAHLAVGHDLEQASGVSLKRVARTLRKYQTFTVEVAGQVVHAATPVPADVRQMLARIGVDIDQ